MFQTQFQNINPETDQINSSCKNEESSVRFDFKFVPFDEGDKIRLDNQDMLFVNDNDHNDSNPSLFKRATSDGLINKGFMFEKNN